MRTRTVLLPLAAILAFGLLPVTAQVKPGQEPAASENAGEKKGGGDLGMRSAIGEIEVTEEVARAGKVVPADPAALRRLFPESLGGLARRSVNGGVQWLGPAGITRMQMAYANEAGTRTLKVEIFDRGGFQQPLGGEMEIPPIGSTRREGVQIVEGLEVGGFPALARHVRPGLPAMLHIA
ncbi:MAG: hypothetical protein Q9Q13_06920 [Acidobacteriota bacterium]|nr:hypothetical protein [Acidobacteriota bacterium]